MKRLAKAAIALLGFALFLAIATWYVGGYGGRTR